LGTVLGQFFLAGRVWVLAQPRDTCKRLAVGRYKIILFATLLVASLAAIAPAAQASGVQHLHFEYGPVHINRGQNIIQFSGSQVPKPTQDGWITGIKPNLILPDGSVPAVDVIHLHHAVWLNQSRADLTRPSLPQRFFAVGEEKTRLQLPKPYGYPTKASDQWLLNYMIHDLVNQEFDVRITYDIDFVPATTSKPLHDVAPIWMDVQNGSTYPVFDVHAGSGTNGQFTYPDQANNPYGSGAPLNYWTLPSSGKLVWAGGHLHPGGLWDDLYLDRGAQTAHLFRSTAKYFEKAGPVSWDVSIGVTPPKWNVGVNAGDVLHMSTTYDSSQWSWYETMGIMNVWFAPNESGSDPFALTKSQLKPKLTHGHLKENNNHGGQVDSDLPDASNLPDGSLTNSVTIESYNYSPGNMFHATSVPTVHAGQSITFTNADAPASGYGTWHTITACKDPCNLSTGVAYPTANAPIELDSGQLGNDGQPTAGRLTWNLPTNLPTGTYTYFCRVHPFMRGEFRVVP
jgi:plastocyanin